MQPDHYTLLIGDTTLHLLPQNAVFWPERQQLLVADLHLGKEHVFARRGIAIPEGPSQATLEKLSSLLQHTGATRCTILGDFFHDTPRLGESWLSALSAFLDRHAEVCVEITAGNHDRRSAQVRIDSRIVWHNESVHEAPFVLQHEPGTDPRGHVLAGHLHPVASIGHGNRRRLRSRCFWHQPNCTVLPAFGTFTGGHVVAPAEADAIYLADAERVIEIPHNALAGSSKRFQNQRVKTP